MASYPLGHQTLVNVTKVELQRTNERIPGPDTLSFIPFREPFHGIGQTAGGICAFTLLGWNTFQRMHALLERRYVLGIARRRARRGVQCGFEGTFAFPMASSFLSWSAGTKLSIVQVAATSGNARSLSTTAGVCSGATSAFAVLNGKSLLNLSNDRSAGEDWFSKASGSKLN